MLNNLVTSVTCNSATFAAARPKRIGNTQILLTQTFYQAYVSIPAAQSTGNAPIHGLLDKVWSGVHKSAYVCLNRHVCKVFPEWEDTSNNLALAVVVHIVCVLELCSHTCNVKLWRAPTQNAIEIVVQMRILHLNALCFHIVQNFQTLQRMMKNVAAQHRQRCLTSVDTNAGKTIVRNNALFHVHLSVADANARCVSINNASRQSDTSTFENRQARPFA